MPESKSKPPSSPTSQQVPMVAVYLTSSATPEAPVALLPDGDAAQRFVDHNFRWYDSEPVLMRDVLVTVTPRE